jgi:hypothetical protein
MNGTAVRLTSKQQELINSAASSVFRNVRAGKDAEEARVTALETLSITKVPRQKFLDLGLVETAEVTRGIRTRPALRLTDAGLEAGGFAPSNLETAREIGEKERADAQAAKDAAIEARWGQVTGVIGYRIERAQERYEKKLAEFQTGLTENGAAYSLQWKMAELVRAEEEARIMGRIQKVAEEHTPAHWIHVFIKETERELHYMVRESGSSSAASNLADTLKAETKTKIYAEILEYAEQAEERA